LAGRLGFAFSAAIGLVGSPAVPVVALCGDGGFLFSGQELATAVHERVSVIAGLQ
jgi:acetolactate synthase-1/2/3 large subunit